LGVKPIKSEGPSKNLIKKGKTIQIKAAKRTLNQETHTQITIITE
jgi:hypothetical protein